MAQTLQKQNTEKNIRFNKALTTLKKFASKWNENARQILVMQLIKGIREAKNGNRKTAADYLKKALYERFHNDREDQFWWGYKGEQYLGEAIRDFIPTAVLCHSDHLKQIHQFCQEVYPREVGCWPSDTFTTQQVFPFAQDNNKTTRTIVTQALFPFMQDSNEK